MNGYKAVLMAPDGDYVTDYEADTVGQVEDALADQGSRWIFYPFTVVVRAGAVTDETIIESACEVYGPDLFFPGEDYTGRTLAEYRAGVLAEVEFARSLVECPKCHGSGKVSR